MKKILVVDDTKAILKMAKFVLNDKYDVYLSNSGELALEILNRKPIDIVLMDVDMPDMDGVGCMYAYAELLNRENNKTDYAIFGIPKKEVRIVCDLFINF